MKTWFLALPDRFQSESFGHAHRNTPSRLYVGKNRVSRIGAQTRDSAVLLDCDGAKPARYLTPSLIEPSKGRRVGDNAQTCKASVFTPHNSLSNTKHHYRPSESAAWLGATA